MKKCIAMLILVFLYGISASAHDIGYGYTHNHHDYVVVAEVDGFDETGADITVLKHIISAESCGDNQGDHIPPEKMRIVFGPDMDWYTEFESGAQNIVAVIDSGESGYEAAYIRAADSGDYRSLKMIGTDSDTAAFNDFINSGGQYCNHVFEGLYDDSGNYMGEKVTRIYNGEETVIYTSQAGYIQEAAETDNNPENSGGGSSIRNIIIASSAGVLALLIAALWFIRYKKREKWTAYKRGK